MSVVAVCGTSISEGQRLALVQIARLWNVKLEFVQDVPQRDVNGLIHVDASDRDCRSGPAAGLPQLLFCGGRYPAGDNGTNEIQFRDHALLPKGFRGQVLLEETGRYSSPLSGDSDSDVLALVGGRPIWTGSGDQSSLQFRVSFPPPAIGDGEQLSNRFNGETFLSVLPVWLFFREVTEAPSWEAPPLRACMVIDDPNLHGVSYGKIDYRRLLEKAQEWGFHAAMATVPLDCWRVSSRAARLFRENSDRLSLLVHGNLHSQGELAADLPIGYKYLLAEESLKRIESLERKGRVEVDRVMAPPHGVCAADTATALVEHGYEALTTNRWSLWTHNPASTLNEDSGLRPADLLGRGLPVINRFRFKSSLCRNEVAFAALLGQPIIPYGHHQDFSDEMAHVRTAVDTVNDLGSVQWMSMANPIGFRKNIF